MRTEALIDVAELYPASDGGGDTSSGAGGGPNAVGPSAGGAYGKGTVTDKNSDVDK